MLTRAQLEQRDAEDALAPLRARFHLPPGLIYLDGNSLGPLPRAAPARLRAVIEREWGEDLIAGWNKHAWVTSPARLGQLLAPLLGANADEVVVADSTSVNLFKVVSAALALRPERHVILSTRGNFPTDLYVAEGLARGLGNGAYSTVRLVDAQGLAEALDGDTAVLMLTHVDFRSGALLDIPRLTAAAHAAGALVVWDLAHSAGALPLALAEWAVDFAVGCGYKYLNGGPGAPAFVFVRRDLQSRFRPLLQGWFGHVRPFDFAPAFEPAPGIERALCGTPPVLSMAALEVALEQFDGVDLQALRAKSLALTDVFMQLIDERCPDLGCEILTPREPEQRGSQVAVRHAQAYAVMQALIARGVVGDFRAPDVMRFGFAPLYLRFADVWHSVAQLREVLQTGAYREPAFQVRAQVT